MLIEGRGNLILAQADALVNTVNTVGVMGKGVALQFKQAFPDNFNAYKKACDRDELQLGRMFVTHTGMLQPRLIVNFPTKKHWKGNSRLADIREGLRDLVRVIREEHISSIAMPPLGCGLGGLRWEDVRPEIERALAEFSDIEVILFAPGSPPPVDRVVRTAKPDMNAWRAALIKIVRAYLALGFEATHQEAQKLLYFLTESGEPVRSKFAKGEFGPYDQGMRFALLQMEGHYINGFGDGGRLDPVTLVSGALEEAVNFLRAEPATDERIRRVTELIDGFESPYGLELLSTVHWVAAHDHANSSNEAVRLSHSWNARKRKTLRERDLRIAWDRLVELGWITAGA